METLWVDFNNMGVDGVRLICNGTLQEIKEKSLVLHNELKLLVWYSDEYLDGSVEILSV